MKCETVNKIVFSIYFPNKSKINYIILLICRLTQFFLVYLIVYLIVYKKKI